jgi:Arc/MetJ family transcription regulator
MRKEASMSRTNIELNDKVLKEALKLTKMKTKKDLVNYALEELVKKLRRKKILELEGKVKWEAILMRCGQEGYDNDFAIIEKCIGLKSVKI